MEELEAEMVEGKRAVQHLVRSNIRLVLSIARKYRSEFVDYSDLIQVRKIHDMNMREGGACQGGRGSRYWLVGGAHSAVELVHAYSLLAPRCGLQEGTLGLLRAVRKFDPHRGFKFGTYATWWIQQGMLRYGPVPTRSQFTQCS